MRVVYLGHTARLSGAEIGTLRLIEAAERVQATVLLAEDGPLVGAMRDAGATVEVVPLAERARDAHRADVRPGLSQAAAAVDVARYVGVLQRRIRDLRPDVVHTISLKAAIYGSAAARVAGTPCLCHVQDRVAPDYLPARAVGPVRLILGTLPSALVMPSQSTLDAAGRHRRRGLRTAVIPMPVTRPAEAHDVRDNVRVVGIIGRLAPWKGQHVFLDAFAQAFPDGEVRARVIGAALFGEDDYARDLHARAERLGISERVDFVGFSNDVPGELERLDVLVHASVLADPMPGVVLEGIAAGVPVICANAGGAGEHIVDGQNGLLHTPGDALSLAAALSRVASDRALRARIAAGGRETARAFTPEVVVERMVRLYEQLSGVPA